MVFHYSFGIKGLWLAPSLSNLFLTTTYITIFSGLDWEELIEKAREQREKDKELELLIEEDSAEDDDFF